MDFGPTKTSGAVIKEGAFARTYFRDIYSSVQKVMERTWSLERYWLEVSLLKLLWCQWQ